MTTNTHIAAQAKQTSAKLRRELPRWNVLAAGLMKDAADLLDQAAQALEAAPALDAQGGHMKKGDKTREMDALYAFLSAMQDSKLDGARMREAMLEALGCTVSPPPPAVGKPLSDEQRRQITAMWNAQNRNYTVADIIDAVEAAHGIVTKETGNGIS